MNVQSLLGWPQYLSFFIINQAVVAESQLYARCWVLGEMEIVLECNCDYSWHNVQTFHPFAN